MIKLEEIGENPLLPVQVYLSQVRDGLQDIYDCNILHKYNVYEEDYEIERTEKSVKVRNKSFFDKPI